MSLGETICRLRSARNMSQGDLADALGVSRQSVSKWETDQSVPELEKLVKLAATFEVSLDELVLGETAAPSPAVQSPEPPQMATAQEKAPGRPGKTAAIVLMCFGALVWLLFTLLGGFLTGLVFASPFFLCGLVCLVSRKHPALWCAWVLFLAADCFLRFATGINWRLTFWTLNYEAWMNYTRLAIAWCQLAALILLLVITGLRLRDEPMFPLLRTPRRILVGWVIFFALLFIPLPFEIFTLALTILDWIRNILLAVLLTACVRYLHSRKNHTC